MGEELVLSPEELFCLGSVMGAEYIDCAYIAAMEDIGPDHRLFAKETAGKLAARGVLQEDFSGDMELDPAAAPGFQKRPGGRALGTAVLCGGRRRAVRSHGAQRLELPGAGRRQRGHPALKAKAAKLGETMEQFAGAMRQAAWEDLQGKPGFKQGDYWGGNSP